MSRTLRILLALLVVLIALAAWLLLLMISETTLNIQARLAELSGWVRVLWWTSMGVGALGTVWLLWRLLRRRPKADEPALPEPVSREQLEERIETAKGQGVDMYEVERELRELARRREAGEIHVALFGEISTGKSALVRALLPDAETLSDVRGGTTRTITRYRWLSPGGDALLLADMPGTAEVGGHLDGLAIDEATRAQVVIYVTDSDLNRDQHATLDQLLALEKPLVLVLNKLDRYQPAEIAQLSSRLAESLAGRANTAFVSVSAATERQVIRQLPDGSERTETRSIAPQVEELGLALQRLVDGNQAMLDRLSDSATFVLASRKLDQSVAELRRERAQAVVDSYATKAVLGALASVAPGTDLVVQGYLATQLVKELTAIYDIKARQIDTDLLLKLVQQHAGKAHTLLLAVAGNAFKAFPGVGTLAGGALQGLAYGLIFRTLGRALSQTLATRGELHPRQAARLFEEKLGENLETPARRLAQLVVEQVRKAD